MSSFDDIEEPELPNWDSAPEPVETDLTNMDDAQVNELLKSHIDQNKARQLVQRLDGAADDYERNIKRIQSWLAGIQQAVGTAIKIATVV